MHDLQALIHQGTRTSEEERREVPQRYVLLMRCGMQVLLQGGKTLKYDEPNPFMGEGSEELAAVAYRYAMPF